jgi:hypothetical protein
MDNNENKRNGARTRSDDKWYVKLLKPEVIFPALLAAAASGGFYYSNIVTGQAADHEAIAQLKEQLKIDEDKYGRTMDHVDKVLIRIEDRLGIDDNGVKNPVGH